MKTFTFPLESVMKYRDWEKDQAEIALGRALAAEGKIQGDIDSLASRAALAAENAKGTKDFRIIETSHEFHALVEQKTAVLLTELEAAQKVSAEKREAMKSALQKSEALHRLRDRQLEEYRDKSNHEEIEIQDDIATSRHRK